MSSPAYSQVPKGNEFVNDTVETVNDPLENGAQHPMNAPAHPQGKKRSSRLTGILSTWWLWEIFAFCFSLLFFIAIVVILWWYNGKPLSDWKHGITINALISLFGTFMRASLLVPVTECIGQLKWVRYKKPRKLSNMYSYDRASRGPSGSLSMLFSVGPMHLASVGALVTIATLALSPFIQQVVVYTPRTEVAGSAATIPRTIFWALTGGGSHLQKGLSLSTRAAIYNGILNNDTSFLEVQPNCSSGNCTFSKPYTSLGVCSRCQNVTQSIRVTSRETNANITLSTYSLPNGLIIDDVGSMYINSTGSNYNDTVWSGFKIPVSIVSIIASTNDATNTPGYGFIEGPWAAECILYYCVRQYTAVVTNNVLEETTHVTYSNDSIPLSGAGYTLTPPDCASSSGGYEALGWNFTSCDYTISELSMNPLSAFVEYITSQMDFQLAVYNNGSSTYDNVVALVDRLAQSLTSHIRSTGSYGDPAQGVMSSNILYIQVRWQWLALPAALIVMAFVLLVVTIFRSFGKPLWKSSLLPILFYTGVDFPASVPNPASMRKVKGMVEAADNIDAVLLEGGNGHVKLVPT